MNIGINLVKLREQAKMTQSEVADMLGVSRPMLAQVERGTKQLSMMMAYKLTQILKCKLEDFVSE